MHAEAEKAVDRTSFSVEAGERVKAALAEYQAAVAAAQGDAAAAPPYNVESDPESVCCNINNHEEGACFTEEYNPFNCANETDGGNSECGVSNALSTFKGLFTEHRA